MQRVCGSLGAGPWVRVCPLYLVLLFVMVVMGKTCTLLVVPGYGFYRLGGYFWRGCSGVRRVQVGI